MLLGFGKGEPTRGHALLPRCPEKGKVCYFSYIRFSIICFVIIEVITHFPSKVLKRIKDNIKFKTAIENISSI